MRQHNNPSAKFKELFTQYIGKMGFATMNFTCSDFSLIWAKGKLIIDYQSLEGRNSLIEYYSKSKLATFSPHSWKEWTWEKVQKIWKVSLNLLLNSNFPLLVLECSILIQPTVINVLNYSFIQCCNTDYLL